MGATTIRQSCTLCSACARGLFCKGHTISLLGRAGTQLAGYLAGAPLSIFVMRLKDTTPVQTLGLAARLVASVLAGAGFSTTASRPNDAGLQYEHLIESIRVCS